MSTDYKTVQTTVEVWCAIRQAHPELIVYGSFSAPDGNYFGNQNEGKMFTSFCFKQGNFPIIEVETTWQVDREDPTYRTREQSRYWLCLPVIED